MLNTKLTENDHEHYVPTGIDEYTETQATLELFSLLSEGEKSGQKHGWLSMNDLKRELSVVHD